MRLGRVHHMEVSVPKDSEAQCRRFYREILGLHEVPKPESLRHRGGMWFALGDFEIHMVAEDVKDRVVSGRHVAFQVDDLDAVRYHLIAHGVHIDDDRNPIPAWERFYCRDPFGNRIEFMQLRSGERG